MIKKRLLLALVLALAQTAQAVGPLTSGTTPASITNGGGVVSVSGTGSVSVQPAGGQSLLAYGSGVNGFYNGPLELGALGAQSVAGASLARMYYDGTNLKLSMNGGAYTTLGGGGSTPTGTGFPHITSGAQDAAAVGETGTGNVVRDTSPTLVTPNIGAATGTSLTVSGGTITGGSTGLSLAAGGTNQNITLTPSGTGTIRPQATIDFSGLGRILNATQLQLAGAATGQITWLPRGNTSPSGTQISALSLLLTNAGMFGWSVDSSSASDTALARNKAGATESNSGTAGKFGQHVAGTIALQSLSTPSTPTAAVVGTAGTTTITYKVTAEQADGTSTDASAGVTVTTANATLSGTNKVTITMGALPAAATRWAIYRTATNGTSPTTTGKIGTATTTTFDDTGLAGDSSTAPAANQTGRVTGGIVGLKAYTVATLPGGTQGDMAYVTDATAPTYNGALTGGGAVVIPVFFDGVSWKSH